jgi:hypothetical protein
MKIKAAVPIPIKTKSGLGASPLVPFMGYTMNTTLLSPGA